MIRSESMSRTLSTSFRRSDFLPFREPNDARTHRLKPSQYHRRKKSHEGSICASFVRSSTVSADLAQVPGMDKISKLTARNAAWMQQQEPFCRLPLSISISLADSVQVQIVPEGQTVLSTSEKVGDLIVLRQGTLHDKGGAIVQAGMFTNGARPPPALNRSSSAHL